jgi:hypothetical protein
MQKTLVPVAFVLMIGAAHADADVEVVNLCAKILDARPWTGDCRHDEETQDAYHTCLVSHGLGRLPPHREECAK